MDWGDSVRYHSWPWLVLVRFPLRAPTREKWVHLSYDRWAPRVQSHIKPKRKLTCAGSDGLMWAGPIKAVRSCTYTVLLHFPRTWHTSWPRAKYFPVRPSHSVNKYICYLLVLTLVISAVFRTPVKCETVNASDGHHKMLPPAPWMSRTQSSDGQTLEEGLNTSSRRKRRNVRTDLRSRIQTFCNQALDESLDTSSRNIVPTSYLMIKMQKWSSVAI